MSIFNVVLIPIYLHTRLEQSILGSIKYSHSDNTHKPEAVKSDGYTLLTSRFIALQFSLLAAGSGQEKVRINAPSCRLQTSISLSGYRVASQLNTLLSVVWTAGHRAVKWLVTLISLSHAVNWVLWHKHDSCSPVKSFCFRWFYLHLTTFISILPWKTASDYVDTIQPVRTHNSGNTNVHAAEASHTRQQLTQLVYIKGIKTDVCKEMCCPSKLNNVH